MKKTILFIFKLPPPINGATSMNNYIYRSEKLKINFNRYFINYGLARSNDDFGSLKFRKIIYYLKSLAKSILYLINKKIDLCYITIAPKGIAFVKDSMFILLLKLFRKKYVIHLHGKGINYKVQSSILWKLYYTFIFKNSNVICLSKRLIQDIERIYNGKPFIVPNGINISDYNSIKVKKNDKIILLFLSNLYKQKGIYNFIEAIKIIARSTDIPFEGWIVGNSTREISIEDLKNSVSQEGISKFVKILGPKYGKEKMKVLKKSDIFIFPTFYEAFGIVNIEAMEAGLPVISTKEGGIPDVIEDGINGYIVEKNNINQLKDKILFLMNNSSKRREMSDNNRLKFRQKYTLEIFEDNIIKGFESILKP